MQPTFPSQFLVNQAKCKQSSLKMLFFPHRWAQLVSILLQGQEAWWRHHSSVTLWGLGNKWRFCRLLRGWMHKPVVCWRLHESQSVSYVQGIIKQYQVILKTLSTFDPNISPCPSSIVRMMTIYFLIKMYIWSSFFLILKTLVFD